jgi:hypothetical protein
MGLESRFLLLNRVAEDLFEPLQGFGTLRAIDDHIDSHFARVNHLDIDVSLRQGFEHPDGNSGMAA